MEKRKVEITSFPCKILVLVGFIPTDRDIGYIFEVDLHYLQSVHEKLSDYFQLLKTRLLLKTCFYRYRNNYTNLTTPAKHSKLQRRLTPSLHDKKNYVIHEMVLKQSIEQGLVVKKVQQYHLNRTRVMVEKVY